MKLKLILPKSEKSFINDHRPIKEFMDSKVWFAPSSLPLIAALTPEGIEVSITDENVEPIDFNEKIDLVGISAFTSLAVRAYEIADNFKNKGVKVVLGGIHPSVLPEEAILHADAVVIGEAENVWAQLINDFLNGKLGRFYQSSTRADLKKLLIPRWDLLKLNSYRAFLIQTTRGCPFNCSFCSVKAFFGDEYRFKPIENVIQEIKALQDLGHKGNFFFVDDNFAANVKRTEELLLALKKLKINNWTTQISINTDERILKLMADCGCSHVVIGLESVSQKTVDSMNKGTVNRVEYYSKIIKKIHSYGIGVVASFIAGHDSDDINVFDEIKNFAYNNNIEFPLVSILTPYPGTDIAKQLRKDGRISCSDWRNYDSATVCFRPNSLSSEELGYCGNKINKEFYEYGNLYFRLSKSWGKGILTKKINLISYFFNKKRLKFSLSALRLRDKRRAWFILKSLWRIPSPKFYTIFLGLTLYDILYDHTLQKPANNRLKRENGLRN
ncbi:MAG: radical SAM protein [Candidatus Omnitrophota bacterium]